MSKKYITNDEASEIITQLGLEFVIINNPDNIYPPYEICPLSPKITYPLNKISSVVLNMEGILASTEELHLHALEYMIRQISGRFQKEQWAGLDKIIDYPNILSNPNLNPVEFLIQRYHNFIRPEFFRDAYLHSALWILILGKDEDRKKEVRKNLISLGCKDMLNDPKLAQYIVQKEFGKFNANLITNYFMHKYCLNINLQSFSITTHAAADIYFKRYHEILEVIRLGEGKNLEEELFDGNEKQFIKPVSGIAIFIAITKGWIGKDAGLIFDVLIESLKTNSSQSYRISDIKAAQNNMMNLASIFEKEPLSIGLVSSELRPNTFIVIEEVLNNISVQIRQWKISEEKKAFILEKFSDWHNVFDTVVTASDISKFRQKPYNDIFSVALDQLGMHRSKFSEIIGIENSENGIISLRSSGIGMTIAIPPTKGNTQNLSAASYILPGGLPEILLNYNCFLAI